MATGRKEMKQGSEIPANLDHTLADTSKPTIVLNPETNEEVLLECINTESSHSCFFKDESVEIYKNLNTPAFATGRLILKPFKEKGHQFVHMDTIAFHVIHGKIIVTLHKTSYYLTTGDYFYVPAGNGYNIRNLLNEESVLLFTQLKKTGEELSAEKFAETLFKLLDVLKFFYIQKVFECAQLNMTNEQLKST